ncbi:hypothetical protein PFNF54_02171 [Plasmodium falciparum NF54]|uniref:Uncharacterized protein n=1 Tax=Plasmodium falciparum (isolate NF54) TaxID=5843 RepID=W7K7A2_PLAFO|nr:hypothetical protein PFNF54_02171 [Plasmodium falciparum NF54]
MLLFKFMSNDIYIYIYIYLYLPISFGIITSCSFLYVHNLYMSRKTISKLIHLYLMSSNERGVSNKIDQIYKTEEPSDYLYLTRNIS